MISQTLLISDDEALKKTVAGFLRNRYVSIDTESDSLYAYDYKLCLVQMESEGLKAIVDPLQTDISLIKPLLESGKTQKIFHSADSDVKVLKLAFATEITNIFDVMLAAKYLGVKRCGLDSLVREHFGVNLNKKFQKANWGRRPLEIELLNYAILDVVYLKKLRDIFLPRLREKGLLREISEEFASIAGMKPVKHEFNKDAWVKVVKARNLDMASARVFKQLYREREKNARKLNIPPFKIISEETMVLLARRPEDALANMRSFKGVTNYVYRRHGHWLKEAVKKGMADANFRMPVKVISPEKKSFYEELKRRQKKLREWRRETAKRKGMLSEVIVSGDLLDKIAAANPRSMEELSRINGILKTKLEIYGREILECLNGSSKNLQAR